MDQFFIRKMELKVRKNMECRSCLVVTGSVHKYHKQSIINDLTILTTLIKTMGMMKS